MHYNDRKRCKCCNRESQVLIRELSEEQIFFFFFSSRRGHTSFDCDWSSDVCSSDLIETSTPARLPATFATWFSVSETANADDRISSPISRCTVESSDSLASPAASAAVNATAIAASRLKNQAHAAVTTGARGSMANSMNCGARDLIREPIAIAARPPSAAAATRAPSATLCDTPKCPERRKNARKKTM